MTANRIPAETFFLDRASDRSLQAQIREAVIAAILSRQALPGARMPSSRALSTHLGVARMTVTLAFQELVAQGYLDTRSRSAYVVAESEALFQLMAAESIESRSTAVPWQNLMSSSLATRRRVIKPQGWRSFKYPFVYGQMDESLFRHSAWRDCARQAMGMRDFNEMAGDLAASDDPLLVNYIRARALPHRGISATADQILVTLGAQNALWLTIELLTRRPLRAVCENPGYPDTLQALRWCGADVTTLDVDHDGLPPGQIPDGTQAVFVTPSHHAPTGATMPPARRHALLSAANERDFVIVEDDYEFEMSFLEPPSPALKSYDRNDRVLYVGSFSKALFPGLRLGYLVGPSDFIAEARELRSMMVRHPPGHLQRTVAYFLAQGHFDLLMRDMRRQFALRRKAMQQALAETDLSIAGAARFGGSSLWIKGPPGLDASTLAVDLLEDSVLIEPGAPFFDGVDGPIPHFRLGFSSIPAARIAAGVELIGKRVSQSARSNA